MIGATGADEVSLSANLVVPRKARFSVKLISSTDNCSSAYLYGIMQGESQRTKCL